MFGQPGDAVLGSAAAWPLLQRPDPLGQHGDVHLDRINPAITYEVQSDAENGWLGVDRMRRTHPVLLAEQAEIRFKAEG